MNEYIAQKNGFNYCGPSLSRWGGQADWDAWEKDKKIAKQIKKEYEGADYVIVTGQASGWLGKGSKAIYGNSTFTKLWPMVAYGHTPEQKKGIIAARKAALKAKYDNELAELDHQLAQVEADEAWIASIRK